MLHCAIFPDFLFQAKNFKIGRCRSRFRFQFESEYENEYEFETVEPVFLLRIVVRE